MPASCGVGESLQRERVRSQLSLEEVSQATKISTRFLKAIEAEEFEVLPGLVFVRNFVRQYASYLKLDPGPLLAMLPRVNLESAPMPHPPDRFVNPPWDPRWNSTFASLVWTVLAAGAAVGAYLHFNRGSDRPVIAQAAPVSQAPAPNPTPLVHPVSDTSASASASSTASAPAVETPAANAMPSHAVEVLVAARQDSWVQATADGKPVFTGTLKAGETRSIAADSQVKIRAGNAGGVDVSLNGKPIDALGPVGQPRTFTLTAEGLQVAPVAPVPPQNPPGETSPL